MTTLNIHQRLAAVAANPEVAYIKKSTGIGQGEAKGVARDYVVAKVRSHLLAAGIYPSAATTWATGCTVTAGTLATVSSTGVLTTTPAPLETPTE